MAFKLLILFVAIFIALFLASWLVSKLFLFGVAGLVIVSTIASMILILRTRDPSDV